MDYYAAIKILSLKYIQMKKMSKRKWQAKVKLESISICSLNIRNLPIIQGILRAQGKIIFKQYVNGIYD